MSQRGYSLDFKASAVKLVTEQGRGAKDVAVSLGVPYSTIQYWLRRPATDHRESLRLDNARLREENKRLIMEREILKKATASAPRSSGEEESFDSKPLIGTLRVINPAR